MAIRKTKMTTALLAAVGMALCLAGCAVSNSTGPSGLSDISYAYPEKRAARSN